MKDSEFDEGINVIIYWITREPICYEIAEILGSKNLPPEEKINEIYRTLEHYDLL